MPKPKKQPSTPKSLRVSDRHLRHLAAIEIQKAEGQHTAVVVDFDDQLSARSVLDVAVGYGAFYLHGSAVHTASVMDQENLRFVLIAHGQMKHARHIAG